MFPTAGVFIFNLGFATFFDVVAQELLVKYFCYYLQNALHMEHAKQEIKEVPWLEDHLFLVLICGSSLGAFASAAYMQAYTLDHPYLPTIVLGINVLFWAFNVFIPIITSVNILFLWMFVIGGLRNCQFINFLFLANADTDLECDMKLIIYERELVVNLLLIAYDIGTFYAISLTYYA